MLVRYEDLVLNAADTMRRIGDFLGLGSLAASAQAEHQFPRHGTSPTPSTSVGRWRRDLGPEEVSPCAKRYGSFMEQFGYH